MNCVNRQRGFPDNIPCLGIGVKGYKGWRRGGIVYILLIVSEEPRKGNVSRYLNSLPKNREIQFLDVVNKNLRGMLERRGFHEELVEVSRRCREYADGPYLWAYVRKPIR